MADEVKRNTVLTKVGYDLMSRSIIGNKLDISKVVLGDGQVPPGISDVKDMTSVVKPKMTLPVAFRRVTGTGTAIIECELKNTELDVGFFASELGVYAKDPDTGDEVLYAYRNTSDYPDYVPAAGSGEVLNQIYSIIIVVGQIENVNVTITEGVGGVSRAEYYTHLSDVNPHPQFLQVDVNKVKNFKDVWVSNGEQRRLQRIGKKEFQAEMLGGEASTIPELAGRTSQLELEVANMAFVMADSTNKPKRVISSTEPLDPTVEWRYRENAESSMSSELFSALDLSNMVFYDNFKPITEVNTLRVKVKAVTAGSRTVGLASLENVHPGESYTLTDGVNSEFIQVKSSSKNANVHRIVCKNDILHTYDLTKTYIYRTTAGLKNGKLLSAWHPGEEIIFKSKEFRRDGIRKLAYAQGLVRHSKLKGVKMRGFVSFLDEIIERKGVILGEGTGAKQTIPLPDDNIDYTTIKVYVNGVETESFDANTETNPAEVTLTVANGVSITADYKCNYNEEDWKEMDLVTVQEYGNSGMIASKFEYSLKDDDTENTRVCIKWRLEATDDTAEPVSVYGVAEGFAKVKDLEAGE